MSHAVGPSQSPPNSDAIDSAGAREDAQSIAQPSEVERPPADAAAPALQRTVGAAAGNALSVAAPSRSSVELPWVDDPYLTPARLPQRPQLSTLAVSSVISALLLGPLGAVLAIVFGWVARREIARGTVRRRGYGLATAGLILGVLFTFSWGAAGVLGLWMWKAHRGTEVASTPREGEVSPEPASTGSPAAPVQSPPAATSQPGGSVPQHTTYRRVGGVALVDIGIDASALSEELARQRAEAHAIGEKVLVMTTSDPCEPCRGVDRSLGEPMMQTALRGVRIVRVDIDVFREDLDQLKVPRRLYPGFFLLSPDLTPRDGINGGEWDDDVARNIAPVLGAFVRGQYATRRQPWQPLPGSGMRL